MSDQVKFVGLHREREREKNGGVIYMSDQVKFVGVHRGKKKNGKGGGYTYVGLSKFRGST